MPGEVHFGVTGPDDLYDGFVRYWDPEADDWTEPVPIEGLHGVHGTLWTGEAEQPPGTEYQTCHRDRAASAGAVSPCSQWSGIDMVHPVPEPGTSAQLLVVMMAAAVARRWRKKR